MDLQVRVAVRSASRGIGCAAVGGGGGGGVPPPPPPLPATLTHCPVMLGLVATPTAGTSKAGVSKWNMRIYCCR